MKGLHGLGLDIHCNSRRPPSVETASFGNSARNGGVVSIFLLLTTLPEARGEGDRKRVRPLALIFSVGGGATIACATFLPSLVAPRSAAAFRKKFVAVVMSAVSPCRGNMPWTER